MATCARIRAESQGQFLAQGLHRFAERYGTPDEAALAAFLSENGRSDSVLATSLARAFLHFWRGDYEACAHVAVPKVEAAARALLRELDEGIYKLQVGQAQGQYPMLHPLLKELQELAMDESWTYFLLWLLLAPPGMNVRNDLAHGFIGDISPIYAALILRAAALLIRPPASLSSTRRRSRPACRPGTASTPRPRRHPRAPQQSTPLTCPRTLERRASRAGRRDHGHGS